MKIEGNKKMRLRFIAAVLAVVMILIGLAGCGSTSPTAISFGDVKISANMFCYWMSRYKAVFLYSYFGTDTDNAQIWTQELASGVTIGAFLESIAISNIMSNAICLKLFDDYGLKLTNDEMNSIDQNIETKIQTAGSKSALNSALSAYGVNSNILRDIYIAEAKISSLQTYLYGDNGIDKATDLDITNYYESNYYRCKHILIRTDVKYLFDDNGDPVVDTETSTYKTINLTDEEKITQKELAADLEKRLAAGEDYDALVIQYSEDTGMQYFADGYYINSSTNFLPSEIVTAVANMNIGEIKTVESSFGIHIVKRYELIDGAYNDELYATSMFGDMISTVTSVKMQTLISQYADLVVTNDDIIDDYPLIYTAPNFYY